MVYKQSKTKLDALFRKNMSLSPQSQLMCFFFFLLVFKRREVTLVAMRCHISKDLHKLALMVWYSSANNQVQSRSTETISDIHPCFTLQRENPSSMCYLRHKAVLWGPEKKCTLIKRIHGHFPDTSQSTQQHLHRTSSLLNLSPCQSVARQLRISSVSMTT